MDPILPLASRTTKRYNNSKLIGARAADVIYSPVSTPPLRQPDGTLTEGEKDQNIISQLSVYIPAVVFLNLFGEYLFDAILQPLDEDIHILILFGVAVVFIGLTLAIMYHLVCKCRHHQTVRTIVLYAVGGLAFFFSSLALIEILPPPDNTRSKWERAWMYGLITLVALGAAWAIKRIWKVTRATLPERAPPPVRRRSF